MTKSPNSDPENMLARLHAAERELEVEAALDRIRRQAMAMKASGDLLDIVVTMHAEFSGLGFHPGYFWHMKWMPETYEKSMTSGDGSRIGMIMELPKGFHGVQAMTDWESATDPVGIFRFDVDGAIDYVHRMIEMGDFSVVDPNAPTDDDIRHIGGITFIMARTTHGEIGYSMAGVADPEPGATNVLTRFAGAFDLAYRRFEDLQKAEAQTREAQIEAALERVRARTMAMQTSDELAEVSRLLNREVRGLGTKTWGCAFNIYGENESTEWFGTEVGPMPTYPTPREGIFLRYYEEGQAGETLHVESFEGDVIKAHYEYMLTLPVLGDMLAGIKAAGHEFPSSQIDHVAYFKYGYLLFITLEPAPEMHDIFRRFANVFEQTYTRFLDLKKAEAQAREAQIEASLERVRSRTMAMQRSTELADIVGTIFSELTQLDFVLTRCIIWVFDEERNASWWMANPEIESGATSYDVPYNEHPSYLAFLQAWQHREPILLYTLAGKEKEEYDDFLFSDTGLANLPEIAQEGMREPDAVYLSNSSNDFGSLMVASLDPLSEENIDIVQRFGRVFQQSYTRFIDVQQAEDQAREAQIETALEKVRSRSLAMHTSDELGDVIVVIVEKLKDLGVVLDANGVILCTYFPDSRDVLHWIAAPDFSFAGSYLLPYFEHRIFREAWESKESGAEYFSEAYSKEEKDSFFAYAFEHSDYRKFPDDFKEWVFQNDKHTLSFAWQKNSAILIPSHTGITPSETEVAILKRFAKVFEQSYVRFLDLQKAEAQALEAKIEAALEKVRSRTMGMQGSDELQDAAVLMFQQVQALGIPVFASGFNIWDEDRRAATAWMGGQDRLQPPFKTSSSEDIFLRIYEAAEKGESLFVEEQEGEALKGHYEYMNTIPVFAEIADKMAEAGQSFPTFQIMHCAFFSQGYLMFISFQPVAYAHDIFRRFAHVFEQTYTRFLDLKQVEAQAREAQIEAALERVRARAQAMRTSDELLDVAFELRRQMGLIGQRELEVSGIHLYDGDEDMFESWGAVRTPGDEGEILTSTARFPKRGIKIIDEVMSLYRSDETDYVVVNEGEKALEWIEVMKKYAPVAFEKIRVNLEAPGEQPPRGYWAMADFSGGSLFTVTYEPPHDKTRDLLRRAANVFDLAYRRFKDLQQAEAAARESRIEASLERVRAHAMGMQKPGDISEVSIVMFDEMEALGIESLRSGISIPLEDERYEFHAATKQEDGTTTLVLGNESVNVHPIIRRAYDGWKEQEEHQVAILEGEDLVEYYHAVFDTMPLPDWQERMKTGIEARECFATFPFADGWLYTFLRHDITDEEIDIHVRFARAFGLAYQRYHDLKKAEEDYAALLDEKARTEKALADLRATQKQLIEQEKLASLGSLTAGIAHEIKNPLNFVNNFAEVSTELVEELSEAIAKGDADEAQSILKEISDNSAQIAKHGKRADSIVKAMMQHARGGSSEPEIVLLNVFLEEYINLSWHGMRARDHGFQAEVIRRFDENAGEIRVQPQEMGRVILNLLNNAFDALKGTDPAQVVVTTKRTDASVEITVADNGPGIPEEIREKIFEPFFTTKATGEGTGLGLSLSYDIVTKGHSGHMSVGESPVGGAEFRISLPA